MIPGEADLCHTKLLQLQYLTKWEAYIEQLIEIS